tara:strand:+ start:9750 stop:9962 length:213 start_codon:yes stop_codon:yes gene_type:complete
MDKKKIISELSKYSCSSLDEYIEKIHIIYSKKTYQQFRSDKLKELKEKYPNNTYKENLQIISEEYKIYKK